MYKVSTGCRDLVRFLEMLFLFNSNPFLMAILSKKITFASIIKKIKIHGVKKEVKMGVINLRFRDLMVFDQGRQFLHWADSMVHERSELTPMNVVN